MPGLLRSAWLYVSALLLVYFAPVLLFSRYYCWGDVILAFWPWKVFANEWLARDVIPLWNPYIFCGLPFAANPQTALFYPVNLATTFLPAHAAITWTVIVHVWLCALFMVMYLRTLGCGMAAQCVGALSYALSGTVIARLQFVPHITSFAALPALLWIYECHRRRGLETAPRQRRRGLETAPRQQRRGLETAPRQRRRGLETAPTVALTTGLMFLGGHPNQNFIVLTLFTLYVAGDGVQAARAGERTRWRASLLPLAAGLAAGVGIAAIQLLPAAELLLNSSRTGWRGPAARVFALPPWQMIVWLIPDFFGNPAHSTAPYWGEGNFFEASPYVGVVTLLVALFAGLKVRHRLRPVMLILLVLGLMLGMGFYGPFYPLLAQVFPPLRMFRAAGRWLLLSSFALSVLAAIGWQSVLDGTVKAGRIRGAALVTLGAMALLGSGLLLAHEPIRKIAQPWVEMILRVTHKEVEEASLSQFVRQVIMEAGVSTLPILLILTVFAIGLLYMSRNAGKPEQPAASRTWGGTWVCILVFTDLFWFGSGLNPASDSSVFSVRSHYAPGPQYRLATTQSYVKSGWQLHVNYQRFPIPKMDAARYFSGPLEMALPNTNMISHIRSATGYDPVRLKAFDRTLRALERRNNARAWGDLAVDTVLSSSKRDSDPVVQRVVKPKSRVEWVGRESTSEYAIGITEGPNQMHIRVPDQSGILSVRDTMYPGWMAFDRNGERLQIWSPDGMRKMRHSDGGNTSLVFFSHTYRVGGMLTMLTIAALVAVIAGRLPLCKQT